MRGSNRSSRPPSAVETTSRRGVLAALGSVATVGLAGCETLAGAEQFSDVVVRIKGDSTPVSLSIAVKGNGQTVLSETVETEEVDTRGFDDIWEETGAYTMRAEMADGTLDSHTAEVTSKDDSFWVTAEDEDTITFELQEA